MQSDLQVVYLAGYGRSGSTILSVILNDHHAIVSSGELGLLLMDYQSEIVCSCGATYQNCNYWGEFIDDLNNEYSVKEANHIERLNNSSYFFGCLFFKYFPTRYIEYQRQVFAYIEKASGKNTIIDSSKSARYFTWRSLALIFFVGLDVKVIHCVRGALDTIASIEHNGLNRQATGNELQEKFSDERIIFGWIVANLSALLSRVVLGKEKYIRFSYENLMVDPENTLRAIANKVGLKFDVQIEKIKRDVPFDIPHLVAGNRISKQRTLRFKRKNTLQKKKPQVTTSQKIKYYFYAGWLGYLLNLGTKKSYD